MIFTHVRVRNVNIKKSHNLPILEILINLHILLYTYFELLFSNEHVLNYLTKPLALLSFPFSLLIIHLFIIIIIFRIYEILHYKVKLGTTLHREYVLLQPYIIIGYANTHSISNEEEN